MGITCKTNTDQYMNISRNFRIDKGDKYPEHVVLTSGSNGVSIATKSSNNGFVNLDTNEVAALIKELMGAIGFSKSALSVMRAYWDAKNLWMAMIPKDEE